MGGRSTTPQVLSAVSRHGAGSLVSRDALAEETGLTGEQVAAVMYRAAKRPDPPVKVEQRGYVWRVLAGPEAEAEVVDDGMISFEVVEHLGDSLVLADFDGGLWLAKRIGRAE